MVVISKQQSCQRYIYKIHSERLRDAKWQLSLPIATARTNNELVPLADSQILDFIDEINGVTDTDEIAQSIKTQIKSVKREPTSLTNRKLIKLLYSKLDETLFRADYMCLVVDRVSDYRRACKGFTINGVRYVRLLGTNGGIKCSTIVFVNEQIASELVRRINNGRNTAKEMVPAKLEAYKALVCSGTTPVSMPHGIAVVDDCITHFKSDVYYLTDENVDEPEMTLLHDADIELNASDGYGLMLPSLAARWSRELGLDYTASGMNTRFSWEKGMAFTFDFLQFADEVAGTRLIKDAWGNLVDLSSVELILTTSMLKLWDSYSSCEDYLQNCRKNGYSLRIAKVCPKELENERNLNYQFIQSYDLNDEQIDELIKPTRDEIHDILAGDWRKTVLFMGGVGAADKPIDAIPDDLAKAIMINRSMLDDPFITKKIYNRIKYRINDAKIGVLKVHGNYSIVSGDPYALCQSMFNLPVTGLLKAGELYNKYWLDHQAKQLACFRAPMSCHNNIRLMQAVESEDTDKWYRYMNTCTILNAWDTTCHALNGMDFDGDLMLITDNKVLVDNIVDAPSIMCIQRKATKCVPTEEDTINSNIASFGDDIGKITNRITAMFDTISKFDKNSEEHKVLDYRIKCGQLFQQNAIDKAKGIIANPMPKEWYNRASNRIAEEDDATDIDRKEFNLSVLADKKPYFMRYIYPALMKDYNAYAKTTNRKAQMVFGLTVDELAAIPENRRTEDQNDFMLWYRRLLPVSCENGVMNRICRKFEQEFDGYLSKHQHPNAFDYSILKSDIEYTTTQRRAIEKEYQDYIQRLQAIVVQASNERFIDHDFNLKKRLLIEEFGVRCESICSNKAQLCNILVDICYRKDGTKQLVWDLCSDVIIDNLLAHNDYKITVPVSDEDGDVKFKGKHYEFVTVTQEEK